MNCPYCSYHDSKVIDSRDVDDGIRRRRQCLQCGSRFTTYERWQHASLFVIKKDQRREEFNREMREIRRMVDEYLARGEVAAAEQFMEERRQYLAGKGYYLRKLNQAYFAFYGTYADSPTSISPIGLEFKKLREQSASVKDFLDRAAAITSREDLKLSIE